MDWLMNNIGTIIIAAALIAMVGMIVKKIIADKMAGKSSCSCGCENCNKCH